MTSGDLGKRLGIHFIGAILLATFFSPIAKACEGHENDQRGQHFIENKGQLPEQVLFNCVAGGVDVYLEDTKIKYAFLNNDQKREFHDWRRDKNNKNQKFCVDGFSYAVNFVGASDAFGMNTYDQQSTTYNYFRGNKQEDWASNVKMYGSVEYENLYPGIDLKFYHADTNLKYDFIVRKGAQPSSIVLDYEGMENLLLHNGNLVLKTSLGPVQEKAPYAYQVIAGEKVEVPCNYVLSGNRLSFEFPQAYNEEYDLIIDPEVIAATLSGTTSGYNYGHTATYDDEGNIYTGAVSYASAYPVNTGSFQQFYGGGLTDIAISKLNPTGTELIWASFLGGDEADAPHSMICDSNGSLLVLGSTESADYPTTSGAVQESYGGNFDMVISKFSPDGSSLVGSTYIGGSQDDGHNGSLSDNYGDEFRGEIIVDNSNNVFVGSCTSSSGFPTTSSAVQGTFNGNQDGVLLKINPSLTQMIWSTFLGGSNDDMVYGLRVLDDNTIYCTGATRSSDFTTTSGSVEPNLSGSVDAFVTHLTPNGSSIINSTFWGTSDSDQGFFLDTDPDGNIAIYGQSYGSVLMTPGVYGQAGSGQFVTCFSPDLASVVYSTTVGSGSSGDFIPIAFLVDQCGFIYLSGHSSLGFFGSSLPLTPDAFFEFGGFYLAVLDEQATGLFFATYFSDSDHVDGGTSRFDKRGIVYQAVCAADGTFAPNADAWSTTQPFFEYDVGVFKIDFETPVIQAVSNAGPETSGCAPLLVDFSNEGSTDANAWFWDFDDNGATSDLQVPSHTFENTGVYNVMLIASDATSCNLSDTSFLEIVVLDPTNENEFFLSSCDTPFSVLCESSIDDAAYLWDDGSTGQFFTAPSPGTYSVEVSIDNCTQTEVFYVSQDALDIDLGPDEVICEGQNFVLDANVEGAIYTWQDGSSNQTFTVNETGTYSVTIDINGCESFDEVFIEALPALEVPELEDTVICPGDPVTFDVTTPGALSYLWQDGSTGATFSANDATPISVDVETECGIITREAAIALSNAYFENPFLMPTAFSPNIDGINDCFIPIQVEPIISFSLSIFDRWGNKVFETEDIDNCWTGNYNGEPAQLGVYALIYSARAEVCGQEKDFTGSGNVTLIR